MDRIKDLRNRVANLEEAFFDNHRDLQKQASIIAKRKDSLNELFSLISSQEEREQIRTVLYEISLQFRKMVTDCLSLNERIKNAFGKRAKGSIECKLFIIESEADESGPINHFDNDSFYGHYLEDMPDWILHVNRGLFSIINLGYFEMRVGRNCKWIYDRFLTPEDIYRHLSDLGFSDPDIARIKQIRMSVSYKTEEDYDIKKNSPLPPHND